jgi:hypothetical protein
MKHWEWIFLAGLALLALILWAIHQYHLDEFEAGCIQYGREPCTRCGEPLDPFSGHRCLDGSSNPRERRNSFRGDE